MIRQFAILIFCSLMTSMAWASTQAYYYSGHNLKPMDHYDLVTSIARAKIMVIGESHDSSAHHEQQIELLDQIGRIHWNYRLGVEFINYTQQASLDAYLNESITEEQFLEEVQWGSLPFSEYRQQYLAPLKHSGWTFGVNLPRSVSSEIAKVGLDNITDSARSLLPPNYEIGNSLYFERFESTMKGHVPAEKIQHYFEAQSMWDDTMAWKLGEHLSSRKFMAMIVGEFHVAYGHGLVSRILARHPDIKVLSVSQLNSCDEMKLHPKYGARADILVSETDCSGQ